MSNGSGDIIIKGGSVEVQFDESIYSKDPSYPNRHVNSSKKITRVRISGDINYDSGELPDGIKCVITTSCK